MANATLVKSAQKNVYTKGKQVEYKSEKGKRIGQMLTKLDRTIPADGSDTVFIAKGEPYYWWQFLHSPKQYSKTSPKRSQLTQSSFLSTLYALEESLDGCEISSQDDFEEFIETFKSDIEELRDTTQESLDNMPEGLQQGDTGQLLQERIDGLESWISDIESIELDIDEDEFKNEVLEENDMTEDESDKAEDEKGEESEDEKLTEDQIQEKVNEKIQEKIDEAVEELKNTSANL